MNRTFLVGRLTQDPELRTTPNGIATTRITVAINRVPNANGERITDFINVVVWRRQAENVSKYCSKGSLVGIDGRIQSRSYDAQDGTRRYVTEVVADNITFLGSSKNVGTSSMTYNSEPVLMEEVSMPAAASYTDDVPFPTGEDINVPTADVSDEDPFKDFGSEVVLSDDDLPF